MASNERAGASAGIKAQEFLSTAAGALNDGIRFIGQLTLGLNLAMVRTVVGTGWQYLEVLWAIIGLVPVGMMNDFGLPQRTPKHLGGNKAMLVDVAGAIRVGVIGKLHPNIAVRGYGSTALPPTVTCPASPFSATGPAGQGLFILRPTTFRAWLLNHAFSITHRLLWRKQRGIA